MNQFRSNITPLIEQFIRYRKASGSWNETCYGLNIKLFDHFCANHYPENTELTQEMVDTWCTKRDTETNFSYDTRTMVVRTFVDYLRTRNLTSVLPPATLKPEPRIYIPHPFEADELQRFFHECDSIQTYLGRKASIIRKLTVPIFFRLLYSSGLRTTEARLLRTENVDLKHGVVDIQQSKGYDQHYVVLHDTMNSLMQRYNRAISSLQPGRTYFFPSYKRSHYSRDWVQDNFRALWDKANGSGTTTVAYDLRHNYATVNINNWIDGGFEFSDKLNYLSKSMGHRSVEATRYYYSIVPRLADTLKEKTEKGFNDIVPEVIYDEEK
ncbi:MAG TPA: tyrosine-type recombinase/integrase [Ruminiclostridium sp.]